MFARSTACRDRVGRTSKPETSTSCRCYSRTSMLAGFRSRCAIPARQRRSMTSIPSSIIASLTSTSTSVCAFAKKLVTSSRGRYGTTHPYFMARLATATKAIEAAELAFDRQMSITCWDLPRHGKMGMVCVACSLKEADAIHHDAVGDAASAR